MSALTTPSSIDGELRRLLVFLGLSEDACVLLPLTAARGFPAEHDNCHQNVLIQCRLAGGHAVSGWLLWVAPSGGYCEAMFHSIWADGEGGRFDITPRRDSETLVMFVPDGGRTISVLRVRGHSLLFAYGSVGAWPGRTLENLKQLRYTVPAGIEAQYALGGSLD